MCRGLPVWSPADRPLGPARWPWWGWPGRRGRTARPRQHARSAWQSGHLQCAAIERDGGTLQRDGGALSVTQLNAGTGQRNRLPVVVVQCYAPGAGGVIKQDGMPTRRLQQNALRIRQEPRLHLRGAVPPAACPNRKISVALLELDPHPRTDRGYGEESGRRAG